MNVNMPRNIFAAVILAAVVIPAAAQIPVIKQQTRLERDMEFIGNLLRLGDFERAISYLDHMKSTYGEKPQLNYMYKKAYALAKMYPELERMIFEQMRKTPGDGLLLAELGNVKFLQNDVSAADSLWNLALNIDGANISVYMYVANYKLQFGDYEGAVNTYRRGKLALGSQSAFSFELAGVYEAQRKYPEAVYELFMSLEQSPGRINTVKTRIRGFINDSEDPSDIVEAVEKGVAMHPEQIEFVEILGDLNLALGRLDDALAVYKRIGGKLNDDGRSLCKFAERCLENKYYSTAVEAIDEYFRVSLRLDNRETALFIKGTALKEGGFTDEAVAALTPLTAAGNRVISNQSAFLLGLIYAEDLGDCRSAIDKWDGLQGEGAMAEIRDMAAVETATCYLKLDNFAAAESVLTVLTDRRGESKINQKGMFLFGDLRFVGGDYAGAKAIYETIVKAYPGDHYANNALERLIILQGDGMNINSDPALDRFADGLREVLIGNSNQAAEIFSDSIMTASTLAEHALYFAAMLYRDSGERGTAIDGLQRYAELFPRGMYLDRVYFGLGDLYMQDKDTHTLAISAFNTILENFSDGPVVEKARQKLRQIGSMDKIG